MTTRISLRMLATIVLLAGVAAYADERLMASYWFIAGQGYGWYGPQTFTHVKFYPAHVVPGEEPLELGEPETPWWYEGQSGTYEFTPAEATNFDTFTAAITDGQDDMVSFVAHLTSESETAHANAYRTRPESQIFGTESDLIGCQITRVHLTVHDVEFWTDPNDWQHLEALVTWKFYGDGCPNPGDAGKFCLADIYPNDADGVWDYAVDGDCQVNLADLSQLLGHYGMTSGATREDGDIYPIPTGDGQVDLHDIAELLGQYDDECS